MGENRTMTREEEIKKEAFEYADKELIGIIDFKKEAAFIEGAMWADRTMIEKACEWLVKNLVTVDHDIIYNGLRTRKQLVDEYIKNFRKAMKGGE